MIRHHHKKPDGLLETVALWKDLTAPEVLMVGDRYLTDIYGGNLLNMLTICVDIITEENDNKGAIFVGKFCFISMCREGMLSVCY